MNSALGKPHLHFAELESTNATAKEQAVAGATHGTTITADWQAAGRGRQGRSWVAPAGSALLTSVVLRPARPEHRFAPLAAALAVAETCEQFGAQRVELKWPNDVWIDGRKVAGILVEARPSASEADSWVVIGIGLNTSVDLAELPDELQRTAASLGLEPGTDALGPLLARLEYWIAASTEELIAAWSERDALLGREISWSDGSGHAAGIDDQGNLRVSLADGTITTLAAGEVHLGV